MSGTWTDRLDDRLPLRERDIETGLRDLRAAVAAASAAEATDATASDIAGLSQRVADLEVALCELGDRLTVFVASAKPSRSAKAPEAEA